MKLRNYVLAACLAMLAFPAFATNCNNGATNYPKCDNNTPTPQPTSQQQQQQQDQNQHQSNEQGQGQAQTATGTGTGIAVAGGGDATANGGTGYGGAGGNATSGSLSGAISGSQSGAAVTDSGNSASLSGVNDSGNSASLSGAAATTGDQTTSVANGSNSLSGANASNGDQTSSNANDLSQNAFSGASNGDQSLTNANAASADGSGNSENAVGVNVDASTKSNYSAQALYLPSNPTNIPVGIAGANVTVYYGVCGPLKAIETNAVTGTYFGLVRKHKVHLGQTDRIVPYQGAEYVERSYPDGSTRLFGHQAVRTVAVVAVAGGRSISLGGGQTGGGWGQAGAGGSSAMQQVVNQIDLEPCEAFHSAPTAPAIQFSEPRIPRG